MIRGMEELLLPRSNSKTSYESSFKGDVTGLQSHEGHEEMDREPLPLVFSVRSEGNQIK